jgi:ATP-binding cassette subfamily B protein
MDKRLASFIAQLPHREQSMRVDPLAGTASAGGSFWKQLRSTGLVWRFTALLAAHSTETVLLLASWVALGSGALQGRIDGGWIAAWALCLVSVVVLRVATRWLEGVLSIGIGGLLKQRLLVGAMAMDADVMRRKGAGELLSQAFEAETLDEFASNGGLQMPMGAVELLLIPFAFIWGASTILEITVWLIWACFAGAMIVYNYKHRARWTKLRLGLTHRLVENMTGHRTRLAQQSPREWHLKEDGETEEYAEASRKLDKSTAIVDGFLPRGYLIIALATLLPSFFASSAAISQQAITLGAILFAYMSFQKLAFGVTGGTSAYIAWQNAKPIFESAEKIQTQDRADIPAFRSENVLQLQNVSLMHQGRPAPVLKECTLTIRRGDRLLLEGDSGSGKSTLALLMGAMRKASAGFVLAGGMDLHTLGENVWRKRVAVAPQYHDNYVLSAPLLFNMLVSRAYPHSAKDLQEARELCDELGLTPLLERMPSGLEQMVGETGWQLSQGERSRLFLARALLQNADLVVLDESLAALDPENLQKCLDCVLRRSETVMVIAHP